MKIIATGRYLPEKILSNADLEKMVDTTDEWIFSRTGIRERRIASEQETSSYMGARAAQHALSKTDLTPNDIDLIIVATVTPDATFPSTACYIQNHIGATRAAAFDLQAACSGFLYNLVVADQFLRSGMYKTILVIGSEKLSSIIDWTDRSTCVLFGDGAGAAIVQSTGGKSQLLSCDLGSNGNLHEILYLLNTNTAKANGKILGPNGACMVMAGQEVFKQAVTEMAKSARKSMNAAGITIDDLRCVITHQANIRIIDALADRLKIPKEKTFVNVQRYGNISAACIPVAMSEAEEEFKFQPGDKILLVAFGGGLTWASAVIEW
ncbi:MAG: beta-ketoacyl-ACP synthase III [Blastochloris sp.]|nr:beta-ketoacyl-ACP synthase III [Blastochloris sp.]